MAKEGRPEKYSIELANKVCERLAMGKSLRTVCKDDDMPAMSTVFTWFRKHPEFTEHYEKAKQEATDAMAEEILDISDDSVNDYSEEVNIDGSIKVKVNQENIQRARLRVDTRKWLMAKMKPKKYGEKVDVTSDGKAIKGNTVVFTTFDEANS